MSKKSRCIYVPVPHRRERVIRHVIHVPLCLGRALVVMRLCRFGLADGLLWGPVGFCFGIVVCCKGGKRLFVSWWGRMGGRMGTY